MVDGVKTTDLTPVPVSDGVLINRSGSTKVQPFSDLATQLTGSGAIADKLASLANNQLLNKITAATWADLSSVAGSIAKQGAEVLDADTGTHTDPVIGGTVPNAGVFQWSASPAGWKRIGSTGLAAKANTTDVNAALALKANSADVNPALAAKANQADVDTTIFTLNVMGRTSAPVTGSTTAGTTFAYGTPISTSGVIKRVQAFNMLNVPATIKIRQFMLAGTTLTQVVGTTDVLVTLQPGFNDLAVSVPVAAGNYLGFYAPASAVAYTNNAGDSGGYYAATGDQTTFIDGDGLSTAVRLEFSATVYVPKFADGVAYSDRVGDTFHSIFSRASNSANNFSTRVGLSAQLDAGTHLTIGMSMRQIVASVRVGSTATQLRARVWGRPTATSSGGPGEDVNDILMGDWTQNVADAAVTPGSTTSVNITAIFAGVLVEAGMTYSVEIFAVDGSGNRVVIGTTWVSGTVTPTRLGLWFLTAAGAAWSITNAGTMAIAINGGNSLVAADSGYAALKAANQRVANALALTGSQGSIDTLAAAAVKMTVSGMTISVAGSYASNGISNAVSAAVTFTAAASGKERVDLLVMNRVTRAVTIVAGTERVAGVDAVEYIPANAANSIILARVQVTNTAIAIADLSIFRRFVKIGGESEYGMHQKRNHNLLRRIHGRADRAQSIVYASTGDSIIAWQTAASIADMPYTAGGVHRDRFDQYLVAYPSDTLAALTKYDQGDGAGAVHVRLSLAWRIKAAMDEMAGSEVVTYLNFHIGSTTSEATQYNLLYPARLSALLSSGAHLTSIMVGMNELGSTTTYGNVLSQILQLKAVNSDVAILGVPRRRITDLTAWRYTNEALEAAAIDGEAAFVSTVAMGDDRNIGALGIPSSMVCSTNNDNHPGIFEHAQYGRAAVDQLF